MTQAFGGLPTRNFLEGQFEHYENLNGTTIKETRMVANKACFACTIACGRVTRLGEHAGKYLVNTHPRNWKRRERVRNTRTRGRSVPTSASVISTPCSRPTGCATTWVWTRFPWARRSPLRWSSTSAV